ncbi:DnaJ domain-containing protein [Candidatus Woesearchaeota archaeon]|nr:DnaJ domain-containing protein [Candidatus Woesearchaeota archaeon]
MRYSKKLEKARKMLGIPKSATEREVKLVYRGLARKWHPDINSTEEAQNKMREINYAFQVIMEGQFGKVDAWEDYTKWWFEQFGDDPIWGNYVSEEDKISIPLHKKKK